MEKEKEIKVLLARYHSAFSKLFYQAAKIWNSTEPDIRKENIAKFAMSSKSKSFNSIFSFCILELVFIYSILTFTNF